MSSVATRTPIDDHNSVGAVGSSIDDGGVELHRFEIDGFDVRLNPTYQPLETVSIDRLLVLLQHSDLDGDAAPNGVTVESLLLIVADRLAGKEPSRLHTLAAEELGRALHVLNMRTQRVMGSSSLLVTDNHTAH